MLPASVLACNWLVLLAACAALPALIFASAAPSVPRVSVNLLDAWYNRLPGGLGRAVSLQHMTDACSDNGFNIIRVATAPFWPVDAKLLTDDEPQVSRCAMFVLYD